MIRRCFGSSHRAEFSIASYAADRLQEEPQRLQRTYPSRSSRQRLGRTSVDSSSPQAVCFGLGTSASSTLRESILREQSKRGVDLFLKSEQKGSGPNSDIRQLTTWF